MSGSQRQVTIQDQRRLPVLPSGRRPRSRTGRRGGRRGLYFQLADGECFVAGGIWMPARPALDKFARRSRRIPERSTGSSRHQPSVGASSPLTRRPCSSGCRADTPRATPRRGGSATARSRPTGRSRTARWAARGCRRPSRGTSRARAARAMAQWGDRVPGVGAEILGREAGRHRLARLPVRPAIPEARLACQGADPGARRSMPGYFACSRARRSRACRVTSELGASRFAPSSTPTPSRSQLAAEPRRPHPILFRSRRPRRVDGRRAGRGPPDQPGDDEESQHHHVSRAVDQADPLARVWGGIAPVGHPGRGREPAATPRR